MASTQEIEARLAAVESLLNRLSILVSTCSSKETQSQANSTWQQTLDDIQESIGDHETRIQVLENLVRGL